jgi:alanyl-tRNA synthetase
VLCASVADKAHVAIGMSDSMAAASGLDAGKIIKGTVAPLIKGGGGGQKTLATAGGQDKGQLTNVIEQIKQLL